MGRLKDLSYSVSVAGDRDSSVWSRHRTLFIVLIVLIVLAVLILLLLLLVYLILRRRASHRHQSYTVSEEKVRTNDIDLDTYGIDCHCY
jgi:heme/copper-type cytochrome/quinol oxidase subunit 2